MDKPVEYIGGGVTASVDGFDIKIVQDDDVIIMDEETFNNLVSYARRHLGWTAYAPGEPKEAGGADDE